MRKNAMEVAGGAGNMPGWTLTGAHQSIAWRTRAFRWRTKTGSLYGVERPAGEVQEAAQSAAGIGYPQALGELSFSLPRAASAR